MVTKYLTPILLLFPLLFTAGASAQMAIPVRYEDRWWECWSVRERNVDLMVRDQIASVTVTDKVVNPCSRVAEVQYVFPLPPDAAVDQFTLVVDGRELSGRMLDANEARQIYNDIVRRQRDPGLLEYAGYGLYRSSAFPLEPGKTAELVVHYTSTCKKDGDAVELWYPMSSGKFGSEPIGHFKIVADLQSSVDITHVYSPSLTLDIDRKSPNRVVATYEAHNYHPQSDFQLFYETSREDVGATLLTYWPDREKDGYYLMMVSPSPRAETDVAQSKDILVVLDRSGSMSGEKIQQAREAVRFVFHNLNHGDRFNFISYNDNVDKCFDGLLPASRENIDRAIGRLDRTEASGGTNIYEALDVALSQFSSERSPDHGPAYLIFLTDGLPTVGNVDETAIIENAHRVNRADVRLFTLGVGYDVNVRLLDNLVTQNHGRSAYVKPNESIETKVAALYNRIRNPFMTNVSASLQNFGTRDDCPAELGDLFEGDQLIRVGRIYPLSKGDLDEPGSADCPVTLTVSGTLRGSSHTFDYPVNVKFEGSSSSCRFLEKLWAARRIGKLMEQIQLHGRVNEVVDELIRLSKRYGIVTPYTSFLADEGHNFAAYEKTRQDAVMSIEKQSGIVSGPQAQMRVSASAEAMEMVSPKSLSLGGHAVRMGAANQRDYESGKTDEIQNVRVVGNETLYKRGDVWMTSDLVDLDPVRDLTKFTVVQRYTDAYFALVNDNTAEENAVFASQQTDEKLALSLRGKSYIIE